MSARFSTSAVVCVLLTTSCGTTPSREGPPILALRFSSCSFSGELQAAGAAAQPRVVARGLCGGGAFSGGGLGTGIDVDVALENGEGLSVTFNAASMNQTLPVALAPVLEDRSYFLGAQVPAGVAWVRHRRRFDFRDKSTVYSPMEGTVVVGPVGVAPADCTPEACANGTVTLELTFDHVRWTSPAGVVDYNGRISVTATAGGRACTTSSACPSRAACNQASTTGTQGNPLTSCGPTNETGAELGQACASSTTCRSNNCDSSITQCTLFCLEDNECTGGTSCQRSTSTAGANQCIRPCRTNADCTDLPSATTCVARASRDFSKLVSGCGGARGTTPFGQPPTSTNPCDSGVFSSSPTRSPICTRLCLTNADCGAPLPTCRTGEVTTELTDTKRATVTACQ